MTQLHVVKLSKAGVSCLSGWRGQPPLATRYSRFVCGNLGCSTLSVFTCQAVHVPAEFTRLQLAGGLAGASYYLAPPNLIEYI